MEILVFIGVDRIDLKSNHTEILSCEHASFANVFHIALRTALTCKNEDFLHPAVGNDLHFLFNLLHCELHTVDVVVAVEAAIYTVVLAVVSNIKWREQIDGISKMLARFKSCTLCHLFEKRLCRRGEKRLEVIDRTGGMLQCCTDISCCIFAVIIRIHLRHYLRAYVRFDDLHTGQIFHMVLTACGIVFDAVLFCKCFGREML